MKKLKLTELQKHQLQTAFDNAAKVLHQIRANPLEGKALEDMKTLEISVQNLASVASYLQDYSSTIMTRLNSQENSGI